MKLHFQACDWDANELRQAGAWRWHHRHAFSDPLHVLAEGSVASQLTSGGGTQHSKFSQRPGAPTFSTHHLIYDGAVMRP